MTEYARAKIAAHRFRRWERFMREESAVPVLCVGLQRGETDANLILLGVDGLALGRMRALLVDVIAKIDSMPPGFQPERLGPGETV